MKILKKINLDIIVNFILIFMVVSLSFVTTMSNKNTKSEIKEMVKVYYKGDENIKAVSLMFNVYQGTEEVYKILEILKKYNAVATFFVGGCWADDNIDCLNKIIESNHELGNHGYFHKSQSKLSYDANISEIKSNNELIKKLVGYEMKLFAPPSGDYSDDTLKAAKDLNMKVIMWSKDTIDWRDQNESLIYSRATKNLESGDLILMHPTKATVIALPKILEYLRINGFSTINVSRNILEII